MRQSIAVLHLLAGSLVFAAIGCQAPSPAAKFIKQANRLHGEGLASTLVIDSDLNEYFQLVGDRLAAAAKAAAPGKVDEAFIARVRCHLVNSSTINAFSTGGTHIYITNGVFQQCENEDDLAAAMAHAYAHLINLDLEATKMQPDEGLDPQMIVWHFVLSRYTREQERRADQLGLSLYAQAGWSPPRFAALFQRVAKFGDGSVATDRESLPARAIAMQAEAGDVKRASPRLPVADPKTFISLRQKVAGIREPVVADNPHIYLRAFPNCILSNDTKEQQEAQLRLKPPPPPVRQIEPS